MTRTCKYNNVYGADFETDNDGASAWIVQWAISNGIREIHGRNAEEWRDLLVRILLEKRGKIFVYFHNLAYDLSFMLDTLQWITDNMPYELKAIIRVGSPVSISLLPTSKEFSCKLIFRDSMKKTPGDLKSIGKMIHLPKLEPPGDENFKPGWSASLDYSEDSEDWKYIDRDARIVAVAMRKKHERGHNKSTISGDAWQFCKRKMNGGYNGYRNQFWDRYFPKLNLRWDLWARAGYTGGINLSAWIGHNHAAEDRPIIHEDVNSMYPTVMMFDPLPIGYPERCFSIPSSGLWIAQMRLKLYKKPGVLGWMSFKNHVDNLLENMEANTPITVCYAWHDMVINSVDWQNITRYYDVEIAADYEPRIYRFESRTGLLKPYLDHWFAIKKEAEKGSLERDEAKRFLNALYGRFGLAPETEDVSLQPTPEGWYKWVSEFGENGENDAYLPMAMFITSHARRRLLQCCEAVGWDNVIHSDTDSVIHFGPASPLGHTDALGDWGIEAEPLEIYEGGYKRYIEILRRPVQSLKDINVACAGVPQKVHRRYPDVPVGMWIELLDDFDRIHAKDYELGHEHYTIRSDWLRRLYESHGLNPDDVNTMKLIARNVPGGKILEESTHRLNDNMTYRLRR